MVIASPAAIGAYAKAASAGAAPGMEPRAHGGPSFASLVQNSLEGAAQAMNAGEGMSMAAAQNKAELVDVITAVSNAELALETVVAVRDKVVQAYQDILRMPI